MGLGFTQDRTGWIVEIIETVDTYLFAGGLHTHLRVAAQRTGSRLSMAHVGGISSSTLDAATVWSTAATTSASTVMLQCT
jgi:hypothetical protein